MTTMLWVGLATFALAATLTPLCAAWARRVNLLDVPNARSSHASAMPRTGGVAVLLAIAGGCALMPFAGVSALSTPAVAVLIASGIIGVLGFADDVRSLPALARLAIQTVVAAAFVWVVGAPAFPTFLHSPFLSAPLSVIWLVGFTNAYNFMDGIDGIAGSQAVIAGLGWAAVGLVSGSPDLVALGLLIAAAAGGFLVHNWSPARVFLGDVGSGSLGFALGALPFVVVDARWRDMLCGALLLWPFLFDTTFTILRRARRRENVFAAHRSHLYQRWVIAGRSHRYVATAYAGMAFITAPAALYIAAAQLQAVSLGLVALLLGGIIHWRNVVMQESMRDASQDLSSHAPI